jgi:hypothetical protein
MPRLAFLLVIVSGLMLEAGAPLAAQGAPTPACAALSVAEVRRITGQANYPDFADGDPPGQGAGGGSSCQYGGPSMVGKSTPMLSFVLIPGKNWTQVLLKSPPRPGCKRESLTGVGDVAFFEVCADPGIRRSSPLYVKVGTQDIILQLDLQAAATDASVRPTLIALAKAVASKL